MFFKKKEIKSNNFLTKVCALLIHVAKIDENYTNKEADIYETNLMRRLAGLLYIDNKTMGDIKERVKNHNSK